MNARRAIFLTARREFRERIRSRAFIASTIVQVVIVLAIVIVSSLAGGDTESFEIGTVGGDSAQVAQAAEAQQEAFSVRVEVDSFDDEDAALAAIKAGEVDAVISGDTLTSRPGPQDTLVALLQEASRSLAGTKALRSQGLDDQEIRAALEPEPLVVEEIGEASGAGVAFVSSLLLYIAIIASGYAVATGVVEEKSSRVVEVILAAIKPVHLLAGKVIGIGLLSLGQLLAIVLAGLAAAIPTGAVDLPDSTLPTAVLVAVYFVLGYLVYASHSPFPARSSRARRMSRARLRP